MGKMVNIFSPGQNQNSAGVVREKQQQQQGCVKKKVRRKELVRLRQQVVEGRHAIPKNLTTKVKGPRRQTSFRKPSTANLADDTEKIQEGINSHRLIIMKGTKLPQDFTQENITQHSEKMDKEDQKRVCPKLLANAFLGLFKNGAKGNEMHRGDEFFNATDRARFNCNVFKLLRGDDFVSEKRMTDDKTLQFKIHSTTKNSKCASKQILKQNTAAILGGKSVEFCPEQKKELIIAVECKDCSKKDDKVLTEIGEMDENVNCCSITSEISVQHESLSSSPPLSMTPIEMCKQYCNTVSLEIFGSTPMILEIDPLQGTRLSLQRIFSDSHRQNLLRGKKEFNGMEKLVLTNKSESKPEFEAKLDPIETEESVISFGCSQKFHESPKYFEENQHYKGSTRKNVFLYHSNPPDDSNAASNKSSNFNNSTSVETTQHNKLSRNLFKQFTKNVDGVYEINNNAGFRQELNNTGMRNILQDAFSAEHVLTTRNSTLNSSLMETNIAKAADVPEESHEIQSNLQIPVDKDTIISEDNTSNYNLYYYSTKKLKTRKIKIELHDEASHLSKSKYNFIAAKNKQIQSPIRHSLRKLECGIDGRHKVEEEKRNSFKFRHLFTLEPSNNAYQNLDSLHDDTNEISMNQETPTQNSNISIFSAEEQQRQRQQHQIQQQQQQNVHGHIVMQSELEAKKKSMNRRHVFHPSSMSHHQDVQSGEIASASRAQKITAVATAAAAPAANWNILNRVENRSSLGNAVGLLENQGYYSHDGNEGISRASLFNVQKHHSGRQPIKFIAVQDGQIQRRVPIYLPDEKKEPAYIPTYLPTSYLNPNRKNISTQKQNFSTLKCLEQMNTQVVTNKAHTVSCKQCANTASNSILFCHDDVSNPTVIHENSMKPGVQVRQYCMDNTSYANVPRMRCIQKNNNNNNCQNILRAVCACDNRSKYVKPSRGVEQFSMLHLDNDPNQYIQQSEIFKIQPMIGHNNNNNINNYDECQLHRVVLEDSIQHVY